MHLVQSMAYVNEVPWHGLGQALVPHQPLEVWAQQAGMNWQIEAADVRFIAHSNGPDVIQSFPEQKVLYRSDTRAPLAIVSRRYQVVQPAEILEFYRDLTDLGGFQLETAGVLKEGKKFWALARTGQSVALKGRDQVNGYLLLATACDGTLATTAQFTSVRVVCNNTLHIALSDGAGAVKVSHRSTFEADAVKRQMGIAIASWDGFAQRMKALADRPVTNSQALAFLNRVLRVSTEATPKSTEKVVGQVYALFQGQGRGASLSSAHGTAWGLVNAVTEYADHGKRARSVDHRLDSAWFGPGAALKQHTWNEALRLVA